MEEAYREYFRDIDYHELLKAFDSSYVENIISQVKYFTEKEAEKRDEIVLSYFTKEDIEKIVKIIVGCILSKPVGDKLDILDIGAGSGFFTVKVAEGVWREIPNAMIYAMDITPAMLSILRRKNDRIVTFIGVAEDIKGSIEYANTHGLEIPRRFDAIFSTLTLHHCQDIERVFRSIDEVLKDEGIAVIIDICKHPYEEFREEMGDVHLGFDLDELRKLGLKYFKNATTYVIPGVKCRESCKSIDMFSLCLTR